MKKKLIGIGAVVLALALLLTLAPACGNGDEEPTPGFTPTPGVTPVPGATPTPTPEAKTLKMGLLTPLSGFAAPWGLEIEQGTMWAADEVNAAGGIKVGNDTYMIKIEKGDTQFSGSATVNEATRLIHSEHVDYILGTISNYDAINQLILDSETLIIFMTNSELVGPGNPYYIMSAAPVRFWYRYFWDQAYEFHPEIETVAVLASDSAIAEPHVDACVAAHEAHGREVIMVRRYPGGTSDFYPVLTPVIAKNPDAIDFDGGSKGEIDLMVKQARELGYTGILAGAAHGDPQSTIDIAGEEFAEGFLCNDPDYSSDLYPESTQQLYAEFQRRHPGQPMALTTYLAYGSVWLYAQAIEAAGSIDTNEVLKVLDDPDFEFEWFGQSGRKLGGYETFGIRRCVQDEVGYSEVINAEKVMKSRKPAIIP